MKKALRDGGFVLVGNEDTKLTVAAKEYGYFGYEIAEYLRENRIECEFSDDDHAVMMFTPQIEKNEIDRLEKILLDLPKKERIALCPPAVGIPRRKNSIREAMMSPSEVVSADEACGRVLASPSVSCPPAVPIIACGEMIDERALECFKYYKIEKIRVVKG